MSNPFQTLIPDARAFLSTLRQNNTRAWWAANKATYDADLKAPALLLLDIVAAELGAATGQSLSPKLFRPHRDVRFSKDKTPYTTHLHMAWSVPSGAQPGYFFGISPSYLRIGAGVMGLEKDRLLRYRAAAGAGKARAIIEPLLSQGFTMDPPALKRVPPPYDKDHPEARDLRRKSFTLWADLAVDSTELISTLLCGFRSLHPVTEFLEAL